MKTIKLKDVAFEEILIRDDRVSLIFNYIDEDGTEWMRDRIDFDLSELSTPMKSKLTALKNAIIQEVKQRKGL